MEALLLALLLGTAVAQSASDEKQVAEGERIYADYCWTCHGERLRNPGGGTTFDLRRLRAEDYPRFVNSVMNGKNQMPPWRGVLEQTQVDALWAYIRANSDRP
ncbi:MAG: cytochrome c [Roseiflexus sp.]|uniref:c-type cytochrome n=1 Tax=Roseiflexus sp. TaxID=2562120 RepID=UPI0025FA76FB|nr:cytochrome c [Roseiflexus sp.]MCL6542498.1 cytochrome c [Roseiflexus sp.]